LKKWLLNKTTLHKIIFSYCRKHETCKVGAIKYLANSKMWKIQRTHYEKAFKENAV
jgi:hypothetical protein